MRFSFTNLVKIFLLHNKIPMFFLYSHGSPRNFTMMRTWLRDKMRSVPLWPTFCSISHLIFFDGERFVPRLILSPDIDEVPFSPSMRPYFRASSFPFVKGDGISPYPCSLHAGDDLWQGVSRFATSLDGGTFRTVITFRLWQRVGRFIPSSYSTVCFGSMSLTVNSSPFCPPL